MRINRTVRGFLSTLLVLVAPGIARAEGFLDFALGGSFTHSHTATIASGGVRAKVDAQFQDSFATGVRGGYWFDAVPWLGVGGMVSYFQPDVEPDRASGFGSEDLGVMPVTALLMLRAPLLPSESAPHGHFQPYVNVGPGAFFSLVNSNHHDGETFVDVGVDVHAGATWMFNSRFGAFAEYRFTHFDPNIDQSSHHGRSLDLESTLDTHHVMAGFAWHFD